MISTFRYFGVAVLLLAIIGCRQTTSETEAPRSTASDAASTQPTSQSRAADKTCAARDFDTFLSHFSGDVAVQRDATVDPLGQSSLDAAGKVDTKYVPRAELDFPLIYSAQEQAAQGLVQKIATPAPDQRVVTVSKPDTDIQTTYTFMADPCWKLVGLSDETPVEATDNGTH